MNARAAGPEQDEATRWMADPSRLLRVCDAAVPRLVALPAATPSLRLLADQTAELLGGISPALNGLALLVADPAWPVARSRGVRRSASRIGFLLSSMPGAHSWRSARLNSSG